MYRFHKSCAKNYWGAFFVKREMSPIHKCRLYLKCNIYLQSSTMTLKETKSNVVETFGFTREYEHEHSLWDGCRFCWFFTKLCFVICSETINIIYSPPSMSLCAHYIKRCASLHITQNWAPHFYSLYFISG